ncbi:MAG: methyl-accepting chemotaxis protein [Clostridiales bacterium]|nr:methyl-accepting chemotaxis protein [Clostridiales bacterium]
MITWVKNVKIGVKMTGGFLLIALMAAAIGLFGIASLNRVGTSYHVAYSDCVSISEYVERLSTSFQKMRSDLFEMTLADSEADKKSAAEAFAQNSAILWDNLGHYDRLLDKYPAELVESDRAVLGAIKTSLQAFEQSGQHFADGIALDGARREEAFHMLRGGGELYALAQEVEGAITRLMEYNHVYAAGEIEANSQLVDRVKVMTGIGVGIGTLVAVLLGLWIARGVSRRIGLVVRAAEQLAHGNLDVRLEIDAKDETGTLAQTFQDMSNNWKAIIGDISHQLDGMSKGDFTVGSRAQALYVGDYAPILEEMRQMIDRISETLRQINAAAEQVATGSDQVSGGAQALAAGATEQASSIEELSAFTEDVWRQAELSAGIVEEAAAAIKYAGEGINAGNEHMLQLTEAMANINASSDQIANITKVIEDIAFQTNILALNAAIEAARAGAAGKGFAVVADEVRNLAAKSAEAARQTGELIQASVAGVAKGAKITEQTAQMLNSIGAGAIEENFAKIVQTSSEQVEAIAQIKQGIFQISAVVQTNAAIAEENASTGQEMAAQAAVLRGEVSQFKLAEETRRPIALEPRGPQAGQPQLSSPAGKGHAVDLLDAAVLSEMEELASVAGAAKASPVGRGFGKY